MTASLNNTDVCQNDSAKLAKRQISILSDENFISRSLGSLIASRIADCDVSFSSCGQDVMVRNCPLDLLLVLGQPEKYLATMIEPLHKRYPDAAICIVSESLDNSALYLKILVERQIVRGIIPISVNVDIFVSAVDLLIKGGEYFPATLFSNMIQENKTDAPISIQNLPRHRDTNEVKALTGREVKILDLICEGDQNKNIAYKLKLSENTVKVHIRNIYKKLHVRNRTEAACFQFNRREMNTDPAAIAKKSALWGEALLASYLVGAEVLEFMNEYVPQLIA